jgi:Fe-S-cluster-containing dehydrogenase component
LAGLSERSVAVGNAIFIKITPENCRGCRRCQLACSSHDAGPLNPRLAGIQILRLDDESGEYPVINMECLEAFCGKAGTGKNTERKPACVAACLFGALEMKTMERKADNEEE